MFVFHCDECDCSYPSSLQPSSCPLCDGPLIWAAGQPDDDWRERLKAAVQREKGVYQFPEVKATLRVEGKQLLLSTHDVVNSGIHNRLRPDEIVQINDEGKTFHVEILGYSYQGRVYHVRLFTVTFPDRIPKKWVKKK